MESDPMMLGLVRIALQRPYTFIVVALLLLITQISAAGGTASD